jgi:general L-amino acid transport system permease protein
MIQILKPNRENLNTFLSIGIPLIAFAFVDFFGNTFLNINITGFLPETLSYFFPLIAGTLGLYFIRIEFSGVRLLDNFNKNVNCTTFNALLTLLIIFILF